MRKKDEAMDGGSEWSAPVGSRVTPQDVQQKEFRVTRVGAGYRMREVDEFLDQITDTLTALIAENDRLRTAGGAVPSAPQSTPVTRPSRPESGAVDAFLQREKGFLQDLGGLVQAHAEELRSMIRTARTEAAASSAAAPVVVEEAEPVAPSAPATEPAAQQAVQPTAESPAEPAAEPTVQPAAEPAASSVDSLPGSDEIESPAEPSGGAEMETDESDAGAITGVVAEEPIRLEEPQPARSARSEEKDGDSLRELFWGEE
jgi:DivIVA domain-containing protein